MPRVKPDKIKRERLGTYVSREQLIALRCRASINGKTLYLIMEEAFDLYFSKHPLSATEKAYIAQRKKEMPYEPGCF